MKLSELNSRTMKQHFNMATARRTYCNKHRDRTGNFGYVFISSDDSWWQLHGTYNAAGEVTSLRFGAYSEPAVCLSPNSYSWIRSQIEAVIKLRTHPPKQLSISHNLPLM